MTTLNEPQHQTDEAARQWFETLRWPDGVVCPHCGSVGTAYARSRAGLYRCAEKECRKDFTVTTKTVMERAISRCTCGCRHSIFAQQERHERASAPPHAGNSPTSRLGSFAIVFVKQCALAALAPLGGDGKIVEADETYYGEIPNVQTPHSDTKGRPFTKGGHSGPSTSVLSSHWSNVAATFARSMFQSPIRSR